MTESHRTAGYSRSGLPCTRLGRGPRTLVVFRGLVFKNKPLTGFSARFMLGTYKFLEQEDTTYIVTRKPGPPKGYSMRDMADDYAVMIREELGPSVDVMGTSTGGVVPKLSLLQALASPRRSGCRNRTPLELPRATIRMSTDEARRSTLTNNPTQVSPRQAIPHAEVHLHRGSSVDNRGQLSSSP